MGDGLFMFKTDIEFTKNTLFIDIEGPINRKNILKLKRKLYYISTEYNIGDIILDVHKSSNIDEEALYNFLDEYEQTYGGNISIMD